MAAWAQWGRVSARGCVDSGLTLSGSHIGLSKWRCCGAVAGYCDLVQVNVVWRSLSGLRGKSHRVIRRGKIGRRAAQGNTFGLVVNRARAVAGVGNKGQKHLLQGCRMERRIGGQSGQWRREKSRRGIGG